MTWWALLIGVGIFFVFRYMWKAYSHPYNLLLRQAANMDWVAAGSINYPDGIKNMRLRRGDMVAEVSFKNVNVKILQPDIERIFKDFLEVERWLGSLNAVISKSSVKVAKADTKESFKEIDYFDEVGRLLAAKSMKEKFTTLQGWDRDFGISTVRLCNAAERAKENPVLIAAFILESMSHYQKSRDIALSYLARLESGYIAMAANPELAEKISAEVDAEEEADNYHETLDFFSKLTNKFLNENEFLDIIPEPEDYGRLYAEQLTYLAAYKARLDSKKTIHPSLWNTFKAGIENRMLAIKDDKIPRNGILDTTEGKVFASLTSSYWQRLDELEATLKTRGVDGLVERLISEMDASHWKSDLLTNFFNDLTLQVSKTLLPKIENMLD